MALYKLSDGTSSVDFDPTRGHNIPETRIRQHIEGTDKPDDHEWGNAEKYEVPLINLTKARADQLLEWWTDMEPLTFTPDQASPGDTIQMIIDGVERPLNMWHHKFDSKHAGNLVLCEVSSQSFSSSHVSASQSESCSSFDASRSCSLSTSHSCSVFINSVSNSLSQRVTSSCSGSFSGSVSHSCSLDTQASCSTYSFDADPDPSRVFYITASSCSHSPSCSRSSSGSVSASCSESSSGEEIAVPFFDSSCADPSVSSCSESPAGISCSNSAGGIS